MGIASIFRRAPDRLSAATASAVKPHHSIEHAIEALRLAIDKDAESAANAGASRVVAEAYLTLAGLQIQATQGEAALATLDELRRYPFGAGPAADGALELAGTGLVGEDGLLTIVTWLSQVGRLAEVVPDLRIAVDGRFPHSVLLITALGDALAAAGDYAGASARYRSLIDLLPEQGPGLLPRLRAIAETAPSVQLAQETLGLVLLRQGHAAEAATHLATALALGDLSSPALLALADAYLDLGRLTPLLPVLQKLLDQGDQDAALSRRCEQALALPDAKGEMARTIERICGDALRRQERFAEALDHYSRALEGPVVTGDDRFFAQSLVDRLAGLARQVEAPEMAGVLLALGRARLLAGSPEGALAAYREAVSADRNATPRAIAGLHDLIAAAPALLSARLQLVDLQLAAADWRGALDTLEAIRREMHIKRGVTVEPYRRLLAGVEAEGNSLIGHELLLGGALYGLAEELAAPAPAEAVSYLARVLTSLGAGHAEAVLNRLDVLGLLLGDPTGAHLLQGDACLAKGDYAAALAAYLQVPLDAETADVLCARLERLAQADAQRPEPLLAAADVRLHTGAKAAAVSLLADAFGRDPGRAAAPVVQRLNTLVNAGQCPPEGLALLATALLQSGDPASLEQAALAVQALYDAGPAQATQVVDLCRRIVEQAEPLSPAHAHGALLLGDALAALGQPAAAAATWGGLVGHPQAAPEPLVERLQALVEQAPDLTVAWLSLGDACLKRSEPAVASALDAFTSALHADPQGSAQAIWERLQVLDAQGPDLLRIRLLEAEALAALDPAQAVDVLRKALVEFGAVAVEPVDRLAAQLPAGSPVWLLRGDVEAARRDPVRATGWFLQAVQQGLPHEVGQAETALRRLAKEHPNAPEPSLALAEALYRQGRLEEAAQHLGAVAEGYPEAREQALARLDEWAGAKGALPGALGLARAQGRIAAGDIEGALAALALTLDDAQALPQAHERLQALAQDYPGQAGILSLLVWAEARLGQEDALHDAVGHAAAWLAAAPEQAPQVADALACAVSALERQGLAHSDLALRTELGRADALLAAQDFPAAAQQLQHVLSAWPQAAGQVSARCQGATSDALRRLAADAHIVRGELTPALAVGQAALAEEGADPAAWVERCSTIAERAEPALAAQAWAQAAAWQAQRRDVEGVSAAIHRAVALDALQLQPLSAWLAECGWDEPSRRQFLYAAAALLRAGGPATYAPALDLYRALLDRDEEGTEQALAEAPAVLRELAAFPSDYLPAWEARLAACVRQGPAGYPAAFALMADMLQQFGPAIVPKLLDACAQMDASQMSVHLQRARIHEAAGDATQAAEALLALQETLPGEFLTVEQELQALSARHEEQPALRLYLGDAYGRAGRWEEALAIYVAAQEAEAGLAAALEGRYREALAHLPESVAARWGLSRALRRLKRPNEAAQALDEIGDLDASQAPALEDCLADLLAESAGSGGGWYVYGKLAYRQDRWPEAIERLERSLREGGVEGPALIRLHDMLGRSYWATKELEQALANLRRAVALSPDEPELRQAVLAVRREQIEQAIAGHEQALAAGADPVEGRLALAALLGQRGEHARAVAVLQEALATGLDHGRLRLALAEGFAAQGLLGLAGASLEAALRMQGLPLAERKEALYRLGQIRRRQLRYAEALVALEELSSLDAGYRQVLALIDRVQSEQARARSRPEPLYPASDGLLPPEGR